MAKAAQMLAQAGQAATPFLMPSTPLPTLQPSNYVEVEVMDYGPGIDLSGDRAAPAHVKQILDIDGAPFRPESNDPTNSNRLMAIASALPGTTTDEIKGAISFLYEGRKSSELAEVHMVQVIDELLIAWASTQMYPCGEPLFISNEEAETFLHIHRQQQPRTDTTKVEWWKNLVQERIEANGTTT
jgi:hypothetical protein